MRKTLSCLLCLLMASGTLLTACADSPSGNESTASKSESGDLPGSDGASVSEIDPELLKLNFAVDGSPTPLTFAFAENVNEHFTLRSIQPDNDGIDSVDSAISERNRKISDTLGVEINADQASTVISGLQGVIGAQMGAQDPEIDVIVGYQYYDLGIATQGWVVNLADMVDENNRPIDYIQYDTKDYWGGAYIDALSYKNIVYWVTGDLSLRYIGGIYCTFVNRKLYEQYVLSEYGDLYKLVLEGDWTMDTLSAMSALIYKDDGDQTVNITDTVGYAWESNDPIDGLSFGCQVPYSTKSEDGNSVRITLNSDRTLTFVQKLENLLYGEHNLYVGYNDSGIIMPLFAGGTVGFTVNKVFMAEKYLTDMVDDYMIVPLPKLDQDQDHYVTGIHDGCSIYGISYYSDAKAASAATLEYMAYLSHKDVLPVYYDQALKNKYTNDASSAQMIDLIHSNIETDFVAAWSASIDNIAQWFRSNNRVTGFSRRLQRYEKAHNDQLAELLEGLETYSKEE